MAASHEENPGQHRRRFLEESRAGLRRTPKELPCKYFYDARGSQLFDRICELPEYYPTRTELQIMRRAAAEMAAAIGKGALLIEYGSGSSTKTRVLLSALEAPCAYVPVDISREHLLQSAAQLAAEYEGLQVLPVCADFTQNFALPQTQQPPQKRVVYFPGSTIGNFTRAKAAALLQQCAALCGPGGALLIGVDLRKSRAILERAYDDSAGVTAAFNRNILVRMNRELGADFNADQFQHRALWREKEGRVEMHLVSRRAQTVRLAGERFCFAEGETICTEHSHKYSLQEFAAIAAAAGLAPLQNWLDEKRRFSVQLFEAGN